MTERLSDVEARIGTVHQLSAVITAMRGIAAARAREARERLRGIEAYEQTIAGAISRALAFLPQTERPPAHGEARGGHAIVALCAEQGFAGVFSEHVLDAAGRLAASEAGQRPQVLLVGDRGLMTAGERGVEAGWSVPMVAHAGQAAALADRIADALYERLDSGSIARVSVVHALPEATAGLQVAVKRLVPFDFGRFPPAATATPPLLTLPPQMLLARLAEEYIFAELCRAVILSFAAENEARMRAMIAARSNVAETLATLVARSRQLRQEEITNEIIELAAGTGLRRKRR